jgi:hypothetical protein
MPESTHVRYNFASGMIGGVAAGLDEVGLFKVANRDHKQTPG